MTTRSDAPEPRAPVIASLAGSLGALASRGRGMVLGLEGPPGAGKSWTARTLLRRLPYRGAAVRAAAPWPEVLRALPRSAAPGWAERILERAERGEGPEAESLAGALAAALAAAAPFALLVEDLHEAPEREALWSGLAASVLRGRGTALIATSRSELAGLGAGARVERLDPLSAGEVRALLEAEAGTSLPPPALAWIAERARGNPLFALEHFRFLARQGNLWSDGTRWRWREPEAARVPLNLEALVSERIRATARTPAHRALLLAAALLPEGSPEELRREIAVAPDPDADPAPGIALDAAADDLRRAGIVRGGLFTHPLYREVALRDAPAEERRRLARRAIRALEGRPELAAAFVEPAELPPERARELLRAAADEPRARGDEAGAARLLARASRYAEGAERAALAREAAATLRRFDLAEARRLAEIAAREEPRDLEAAFLLAEVLVLLGEGDEAERRLRALPPEEGARERWWRQTVLLRSERGDFAGAIGAWRERPDLHPGAGGPTARAAAFALLNQGAFAEADALVAAALAEPGLGPVDRAHLLHVRAGVRFHQGLYDEAERGWAEVIDLLRGGGDLHLLGRALGNRSAALRAAYRLDEAVADVQEALRIFEELGAGRDHARQQHAHANLLRRRGEHDAAEEALLACRAVFERGADLTYLVACDIDLVVLYVEWSPPYAGELALRFARSALETARRVGSGPMTSQALRAAARAEALHGDARRALELIDEGIATARAMGQDSSLANGIWTRGHVLEALGRHEEALAAFREAVAMHEAAGHTLQAQMDALEIDRLTGDAATARQRERFFRERGSLEGVRRVRSCFPEPDGPERESEGSSEAPSRPLLRLLGPFAFERDGESVPYRARKGRELLARLLEARMAGRSEVGQLELQDALYPDASDASASSALQQLVYRLRGALGTETVLRTSGGYALGEVDSDAEGFLRGGPATLWRGPYRADVENAGEEGVRLELLAALRARTEAALDEDPREAERLAQVLVESEPYDAEALRLAVRAAGGPAAAELAYERGRARMREVGEELPGGWREFVEGAG